jgi:molybdenum cofactor guanylyltransferase
MSPFNDFAAVILTGGSGSRMGGMDKQLIEIEGETIISRILNVITPLFNEIIISGKKVDGLPDMNITFVSDRYPGRGPLAGIESALGASNAQYLFVFAGDMPWLSSELISKQIAFMIADPCDILVPRLGNDIEPLHAIINKRVSSMLTEYLEKEEGNAVRCFYSMTDLKFFDIALPLTYTDPFTNINHPEDLENSK